MVEISLAAGGSTSEVSAHDTKSRQHNDHNSILIFIISLLGFVLYDVVFPVRSVPRTADNTYR